MKIFSFGFILGSIATMLILFNITLDNIKDFFENMIIIIPSGIIFIFLCWQLINYIGNVFRYKQKFCLLNNHWKCLLIYGPWGSGKTHYYQETYQYISNQPNIYISCFSATRTELITQIIQQQFWLKIFTLNGLLTKFIDNNWQIFMPKNQVIVFDDLERLHQDEDNYLDLIAIIDYLKTINNCKIILICNLEEIKEGRTILNSYLERIVDNTETATELSFDNFTNYLFGQKNEQNTKNLKQINEETALYKLLKNLHELYTSGQLNNLRIIKNIASKITDQLNANYGEETEQVLNGSINEVNILIKKHYLFYVDNNSFKKLADLCYTGQEIKDEKLTSLLTKYRLQVGDFICLDYKSWRNMEKILEPNFNDFLKSDIESIMYSLNDSNYTFAKIKIKNKIESYLNKFIEYRNDNVITKNKFVHITDILRFLFIIKYSNDVSNSWSTEIENALFKKIRISFTLNELLNINFINLFLGEPFHRYLSMYVINPEEYNDSDYNNKKKEMLTLFQNECYKYIITIQILENNFEYIGTNWCVEAFNNKEDIFRINKGYLSSYDTNTYNILTIIRKYCNPNVLKILLSSELTDKKQYHQIFINALITTINEEQVRIIEFVKSLFNNNLTQSRQINSKNHNQDTIIEIKNEIIFSTQLIVDYVNKIKQYLENDILNSLINIDENQIEYLTIAYTWCKRVNTKFENQKKNINNKTEKK